MKKLDLQKIGCKFRHLFLAMTAMLLCGPYVYGQEKKFDLKLNNVTMEQALDEVEKMSDYRFIYNQQDVDVKQKVTVNVAQQNISQLLTSVFSGKNINFRISGQQIVLSPKVAGATPVSPTGVSTPEGSTSSISPIAATPEQGNASSGRQTTGATITGVVTDKETGEPVIGVTVYIRNSTTNAIAAGTSTTAGGKFTITSQKPETDVLTFSFLGYKTITEKIGLRRTINAALESDSEKMEEVVVTGYQTISRERATGAYEVLGTKALEKKISVDATSAIEGQAAGVSTYGDQIVIRGISTLSTSIGNTPLIVLDGLPTERDINTINMNDVESFNILKDASASSIYGVRAANGVIVINTKKAAEGKTNVQFTSDLRWTDNPSLSDYHYASTGDIIDYELASYSRAAERSKLTELTYYNNTLKGIGDAYNAQLNYVTPAYYLRYRLLNGTMSQSDYDNALKDYKSMDYRKEYIDNVWQTPMRQSYNLSLSSGSARQNTYASFNYMGERSRISSEDARAIKGYIKTSQKITDWLRLDVGMDMHYGGTTTVASQYNSFTGLEAYTRIHDKDGNRSYREYVDVSNQIFTGSPALHINPKVLGQIDGLSQFMSYNFNILDELERNKTKTNSYNIRSFVSANVKVYDGITFTSSFDYEFSNIHTETLNEADSYFMRFSRNRYMTYDPNTVIIPVGARFYSNDQGRNNFTFRNQVDYKKNFNADHDLTVSAGLELRETEIEIPSSVVKYGYDPNTLAYTSIDEKTMLSPGLKTSYIYNAATSSSKTPSGSNLAIGDIYLKPALSYTLNRYVGMYAVGGYTYKGRYGVSASVRVDQANLFGTDPKYRYRPLWSIGAKWNMTREDFMSSLTWIDLLDMRASYGLTGNVDQTTSKHTLGSFTSRNSSYTSQDYPVATVPTAPNPLLRWEKTTNYDVGVDFSLWRGLLSGKIDGYYKYSNDLLMKIPAPFTSGYYEATVNYGEMSNKGIEITLNSAWYRTKDWTLSSGFIFSYNKNVIEKTNYEAETGKQLADQTYPVKGKPFNALYVYKYTGLTNGRTDDAQNGVPIIVNKDGVPMHTFNDDGTIAIGANTMKPEDMVYVGSRTPVWNGSFLQSVKYRSWEMSILFVYYGGHKVLKPSFNFAAPASGYSAVADWLTTSWTPTNTSSSIPKAAIYYTNTTNLISLSDMYHNSTANVVDGDFIRLRNVSLSYNMPQKFSKKVGLQKVKITGQINNLWYWSASGMDPETLDTYNYTPAMPTSYFLRLDLMF